MIAAPERSRIQSQPKKANDHYLTPEHKAWRKAVLTRAGFHCEGEGPHSGPLHADHIVEVKDGGAKLDPSNGRCLCQACHNRKTADERSRRFGG